MDALEVREVCKRYASHLALDHVSINIPEKTIFGLLGPNGAGKTTLIRIINQIINADEGEVLIFGEKLKPDHISMIGYLPEERGLYKKLKVGDQLIYLARLKGMSRADATARIKKWMVKFDIMDWWGKKVEELSKGMAQKVQFVSTVMHEPRLIILDEPFSGFDPVNAQLITEEILDLKKNGSTIIFSTHRMETVEDLCDHIALINKSKKILEGSKKQVKEQFRTNTYVVDHHGAFALSPERYQVSSQHDISEGEGLLRSIITMTQPGTANRLIGDLIGVTEVCSFQEKIPTMSEIFIRLVKGESNE